MKYEEGYQLVDINEISLDPKNPRHEPTTDDNYALKSLMQTKKFDDKIINLAKNILDNGQNVLDPIGLLITEDGKLCCKEGNRRTAVLKILNNPRLIEDINTNLFNRVNNLLNNREAPISTVLCYVTDNKEKLDHAVELKHQGEQDGASTVSWGADEKARHQRNKGKLDPVYTFLNSMQDQEILTTNKRNSITKTNWERLFANDGQLWLGIIKKDDTFEVVGELDVFKEKFQLVTDAIMNQTHHIVTNYEAKKKLLMLLINLSIM
jgi:hypothetical protein